MFAGKTGLIVVFKKLDQVTSQIKFTREQQLHDFWSRSSPNTHHKTGQMHTRMTMISFTAVSGNRAVSYAVTKTMHSARDQFDSNN